MIGTQTQETTKEQEQTIYNQNSLQNRNNNFDLVFMTFEQPIDSDFQMEPPPLQFSALSPMRLVRLVPKQLDQKADPVGSTCSQETFVWWPKKTGVHFILLNLYLQDVKQKNNNNKKKKKHKKKTALRT